MEYNKNNIFAKILRGDVPCKKIYEDEFVLAFHDANPQKKIHALVIPKGEYINLDDELNKYDNPIKFYSGHLNIEGNKLLVKLIINKILGIQH